MRLHHFLQLIAFLSIELYILLQFGKGLTADISGNDATLPHFPVLRIFSVPVQFLDKLSKPGFELIFTPVQPNPRTLHLFPSRLIPMLLNFSLPVRGVIFLEISFGIGLIDEFGPQPIILLL